MSQNTSTTALVANNLPIPSALGSLDAYISAVHQIPVLTVEDERALAQRYREEEDPVARGIEMIQEAMSIAQELGVL